mgnify:FL=1
MSDSFNEREKGFEAKFKLDAEQEFKAEARRNRLLGEWRADKFGVPASERADYAKTVVIADMDEPGIEDVMRKVMADIATHGVDISEADVRAKISELDGVAAQQIANE